MTPAQRQAAYAAKRAKVTGIEKPIPTIRRPVRHIGGQVMENPPTITYRADKEAETRAQMRAAGFEFADEAPGRGGFW